MSNSAIPLPPSWNWENDGLIDDDIKYRFKGTNAFYLDILTYQLIRELKEIKIEMAFLRKKLYES